MYNNFYAQPRQSAIPRIRPVSSIEEVRSATIDFDGSIFFFHDIANKCIYTKQINMDGTISILTYEIKENSVPEQPNFITRDEFEKVIAQLKNHLTTAQ